MSVPTEKAKMKFKHQIALAKQNKISWEDLGLILDVLTPTFLSMKQLIKTLLDELKIPLSNQNQESPSFIHQGKEVGELKTRNDQGD